MKYTSILSSYAALGLLAFGLAAGAQAQVPENSPYASLPKPPAAGSYSVNFEELTWPELYRAIHLDGKTTVLLFNGGTEQRGPQGVSGAHTFVARFVGQEIAEKLGNAIVAPVLPFSPNRASAALPGTIGVSPELFANINEEVAEQLITNGFKNVVLLGDHGGGQEQLEEVAKKLDAKYAAQGVRVVYSDAAYKQADDDIAKFLTDNNLPLGSHAGVKDTSELLYLEGVNGEHPWVRKDQLATAVGGGRTPGQPRDPNVKVVRNGISGDARKSTADIGKKEIQIKVDDGVAQIRQLLAPGGTKTASVTQ